MADGHKALAPLWELFLPKLVPNHIALLAGFVLGIIFSFKRNPVAEKVAKSLNFAASYFLKKIFTPLLPLFILGFVFKLEDDQLLEKALRVYGPVFFIVVGTQLSYMIFLYLAVRNSRSEILFLCEECVTCHHNGVKYTLQRGYHARVDFMH